MIDFYLLLFYRFEVSIVLFFNYFSTDRREVLGRRDTQESGSVIKNLALSRGDLEQNVKQIINKKKTVFFELLNVKP